MKKIKSNGIFVFLNFTVKGNLKRHIESINEGKTFKCDICLSSFKYKGYLKKTCWIISWRKKIQIWRLSFKFYTKSSLKTHIQSIHEGKTFKCDLCFFKIYKNKLEKENLIQMKKNGVNQVDSFIDTTDVLSHFVCVNFFSKVVWLDLLELGS